MNKKTWEIVEIVCNCVLILVGILGFGRNLIRIDDMIMNHFGWFVVMNMAYIVMFVLGWKGLSIEEEDS